VLWGAEKKNLLQVQSARNEHQVTPYGWEHNKTGSETDQDQTLFDVNHENSRLLHVYMPKRNDNVLLKAFFRFDFKCPPTSNQNTTAEQDLYLLDGKKQIIRPLVIFVRVLEELS
jgi:hypothetical protein